MKKIKIGDNVKVILGNDKGLIGKVKSILYLKKKIIVEGINTKIKHIKPSQKDKSGKIIKFDSPIAISNVMYCNQNGLASKIGIQLKNNKKIRIFKKTQELIN
jgi:large subunit ribosomal protein L24